MIQAPKIPEGCTCGNGAFLTECICELLKKYPGENEYICEYCGIFKASQPLCNKCREVPKGTI